MVFRAVRVAVLSVARARPATQDLKLWLRVNDVQPVGLRAAADSASTFARPVAAGVPGILGRYAPQRHALDTTSRPRPRLVTQPPRTRTPCKGGAAEFTHPTRTARSRNGHRSATTSHSPTCSISIAY